MASAKSWMLAGPAFAVVGLAVGAGSRGGHVPSPTPDPNDLMGRVGGAWRGLVRGRPPSARYRRRWATTWGIRVPLVVAGLAQCAVASFSLTPSSKASGHAADPVAWRPSGTLVA